MARTLAEAVDREELQGVEERLTGLIRQNAERLDRVEDRLDGFDVRFARMEERLGGLEDRVMRIEERLDRMEANLDSVWHAVQVLLNRIPPKTE